MKSGKNSVLVFFGAITVILTEALGATRSTASPADTPNEETWFTDGPVHAIACANDTVYLGGDFSYVGPYTGSGVPIDRATGVRPASFPRVDGAVSECVPDGSGGWFIGGYFRHVGGVARNRIAHIRSDFTVDPAWDPNANSSVVALAVSGSTVYVGGEFTSIGGQSRQRIAALDLSTGNATSWDPNPAGGTYVLVRSIAVSADGTTVYAGGEFTGIGGQSRNNIAALDASTGLATLWNPGASGRVAALAISPDGSTVYAGGNFTSIDAQPRAAIAALSTSTGHATPWDPNTTGYPSPYVYVIATAEDGSTVYVGGLFSSIGGATRNGIAALDANSTGTATAWNPNPVAASGGTPSIGALVLDGSTVYVGGIFSEIGGRRRGNIAALDAAGAGTATAWGPKAGGEVYALGLSGSSIFVGGDFQSLGGEIRNHLAALDAASGAATAWDPNADGNVLALAATDSTVYAGGEFTTIGGETRNHIAALDVSTGDATPWDPNANDDVFALGVSGSTVYAGGIFTTIGGQPRKAIAALDANSTGTATGWDAHAGDYSDTLVGELAISGSVVYVGGWFSTIGGQTRMNLAALDGSTGLATSWNPSVGCGAYPYVNALAVSDDGSRVFVGGNCPVDDPLTEGDPYLVAVDASSGLGLWDAGVAGGQLACVDALALSDSTVYAGGVFSTVSGQSRASLAALGIATGNPVAWVPDPGAWVYSLAARGKTVYVGGSFSMIGGKPHAFFAQFDAQVPAAANGWIYW